MMGCKEVSELLDAYALGAAEADEANAVEKHVRAPDMKLERI